MKKILTLLTTAPLLLTSCFDRPNSQLHAQRYDGHVEGVAYNTDDPTVATERTRADVKVTNGVFDHVKIERDMYIGREWITIASWNPELDNFGTPELHLNPESQYATQYEYDRFNSEAQDYIDSGQSGNGFWYPAESMFTFHGEDDDKYFYMIGKYALEVRGTNLYISIAGSETSRQTYEDIVDLTLFTLPDGSIDPQYAIKDVFNWRVNQAQYAYGYKGDITSSPFNEVNGSIAQRGTFRDIDQDTKFVQFLRMLELDHTQDGSIYGRHSNNGWVGNYGDINQFFQGKNADSFNALWDRENIGTSIPGEDTIKDIEDGIAGATVSTSRENAAFQDALIKLGRDIKRDDALWE